MSIYNRKMFKRNAREKLNQTAGIQTFRQGGDVKLPDPYFPVNQPAPFSGIAAIGSPAMSQEEYYRQNPAIATRDRILRQMGKPVPPVPQTNVLVDQARMTAPSRPLPQTVSDFLRTGQGQTANLMQYGLTPLTPADRVPGEMPGERADFMSTRGMGEFEGVMEQIEKGPPRRGDADLQDDPSLVVTEEEETVTAEKPPQATPDELTTEAFDSQVSPAEEITRVIKEGTPEEQQKTLADFMDEFIKNAPEYEGADSGLTFAKIGFAMAAGEDPDAKKNIADALEEGADMLIKDKAKKDEFGRQLKLSALQYGLQETGKLDAQRRLDDRNFIRLAATGDVTYNGRTYKKGETVRISTTDLIESGGQLPEGFTDVDVYLDGEKAVRDRLKATATATKALRDELLLSDEAARKIQTDYGTAAKRYIDAEVGIEFTEKALLNLAEDGSITGIKGGVKALANNLANAGGLNLGTKYESKAQFEADVRKAFQKLIPVSLGGVQAANSISNRDVQFLADAYIESAILEGGIFNLAMVDEQVLAGKLGNVINEFRRNQSAAASEMAGIEGRLANRILPGQGEGSGVTLLAETKRSLEPYGVGQRTTMGLEDTGRKNDQGMPIFRLPSAQ